MDYSLKVWFVKIIFVIFHRNKPLRPVLVKAKAVGRVAILRQARGLLRIPSRPRRHRRSSSPTWPWLWSVWAWPGWGSKSWPDSCAFTLRRKKWILVMILVIFFLIFHYSVPCSILFSCFCYALAYIFLLLMLLIQFVIAACVT